MKKDSKYLHWLTPQKFAPLDAIRADEPAITMDQLKKHFTETQVDFIQRRISMECPDLRVMPQERVAEFFSRDDGINDAKIILTFIVQYYVRFLEEEDGAIRGNLKSFWYRKLARALERLGRLEEKGGLKVTSASARSRYLLKTMEDSFEQLFRKEFFHYRELEVYNHRESFRLMGRKEKRHLFYTEKEGLFWFCQLVNDKHSCHAFASRGSATWLDTDYLAEAIGKLEVRNLYIAALTDYDPWGVYIARQIRRKLETARFGFRKVNLEILTDLSLFDPEVIERERRYLLNGHEDPKDPIHKIVTKWVNAGGGIDGKPYGMHVDNLNQEKAMARVGDWIKGKWSNRLSKLEFPESEMRAANRQMRGESPE